MRTVNVTNWTEFRNFVGEDLQFTRTYWRGQRDPSWPLALTYERTILDLEGGTEPAPIWWTPQIARKCGRSVSWPNASGGHSRRSSRRRPFGLSGRAVSQWASSRGNWI